MRPRHPTLLSALLLTAAAVMSAACGAPGAGSYCQSGSKYGTTCYSAMDVQQPPGSHPPAAKFIELGKPPPPGPQKPWMPTISYVPGASGAPVQPVASLAPLPIALSCDADPTRPVIHAPAPDNSPPPSVGQMTELAAQAKRLFDQEKWNEAILALGRVENGDSGDDEGNKQLAQYHGAVSLYRASRLAESYAKFRAMAYRRSHLKHPETLLWLSKFAQAQPDYVDIADFAAYEVQDVARFNNPNQRSVYDALNYLLGRERLQEGLLPQARELLERVPSSHPYASAAHKCLSMIQSSSPRP